MEHRRRNIFSFYNDEISDREFNFTIFIILICMIFRNLFRGNHFKFEFTSDLFFELTLLLVPITLMLFRHKSNSEVANIFYSKGALVILFLGSIAFIIVGIILLYITNYVPIIDFIFAMFGLLFLISGILNLLNTVFIFIMKNNEKTT